MDEETKLEIKTDEVVVEEFNVKNEIDNLKKQLNESNEIIQQQQKALKNLIDFKNAIRFEKPKNNESKPESDWLDEIK